MADSLADTTNVDQDQISPEVVEKWFHDYIEHHERKPKLTKLHFFVHDNVTADIPTSVLVAPANTGTKASATFGSTYVMDAPITVDSDPDSEIIGRLQGTYSFAGLSEPVLAMTVNFVFTKGEFKDSSLSVLTDNPISHKYREFPILGGTGAFRLARGTAIANNVTVDLVKLNALVEYHAFILHY